MKAKIQVRVLAAKRFNMDSMKMSQLYVEGEYVEEADKIGCPVMKMNGDFDVLDQLRGSVPGHFELTVELRAGGQDKLTQYCVAAKAIQPAAPSMPDKSPKVG